MWRNWDIFVCRVIFLMFMGTVALHWVAPPLGGTADDHRDPITIARHAGIDSRKEIGAVADIDPYARQLLLAPILKRLGYTIGDLSWLARALLSESDRFEEMLLVGEVIMNRLHAGYMGATTIKEVVLEPWQFSAFNKNDPEGPGRRRAFYMSLQLADTERHPNWDMAVQAALDVLLKPSYIKWVPADVMHYWSPISMNPEGSRPYWHTSMVSEIRVTDRFIFQRLPHKHNPAE